LAQGLAHSQRSSHINDWGLPSNAAASGQSQRQLLQYVQFIDLRLTKQFKFAERSSLLLIGEVFNLFKTTKISGESNTNYSGYANVLVRHSNTPNTPGYLQSSPFGAPVTTVGGIFGSGGPGAFQLALRYSF